MNSPAPTPSEKGTFVTEAALKRLKKRHAAEMRFKLYGQVAIGIAVVALITLLVSIFGQASSAFSRNVLTFDTTLDAAQVDPTGARDPDEISRNVSGFNLLLQDNLADQFLPGVDDRARLRELYGLFTRLAVLPIARKTAERPDTIGSQQRFSVALADDIDLFLKGGVTERTSIKLGTVARISGSIETGVQMAFSSPDASDDITKAATRFQEASADDSAPTTLVSAGDTWFRLDTLADGSASLTFIAGEQALPAAGAQASALVLAQAQENRTVSDRQIAWTMLLKEEGRIKSLPIPTAPIRNSPARPPPSLARC